MKTFFAAIAALFCSVSLANAQVNLSGTGTVKGKPDMAYVTFAVVTEDKTADAATLANGNTMRALCDAVEALKIDVKDIQTTGFAVSPRYTYNEKNEARLIGYVVNNDLLVTIRDLAVLGRVLDAAVKNGANRVRGVQWDVKEKTALFDAARRAAFNDAHRKANLYAKVGDFKLGVVKSVLENRTYGDEGESGGAYLRPLGAAAPRGEVVTKPGELTFKVHITIVWAIE